LQLFVYDPVSFSEKNVSIKNLEKRLGYVQSVIFHCCMQSEQVKSFRSAIPIHECLEKGTGDGGATDPFRGMGA